MKTIPIAKPGAGPTPTPDQGVQAQKAARERAITLLETKPTQVPIPVNANSVSAEEIGAVKPSSLQNTNESEVKEVTTKPTESRAEQESKLSNSQMAIIARKERALRSKAQQQEQSIIAERTQWNQERAKLQAQIDEIKSNSVSKQYLKQNPLDAISQAELTYDELTQQVMSATPTDPRVLATINRLESKVQDLQGRLEQASKGAQEAQTQQYQAAIKQIENDVKSLVRVDPTFEAIKFTKSERDVVDLIERTYKEEGYVMEVETAAQEVENYLVEEASKLANLEKIKKRLSPPASTKTVEANKAQQTPNQQQTQTMKTLTNSASSSRKLSSRERALLAFKGELKS